MELADMAFSPLSAETAQIRVTRDLERLERASWAFSIRRVPRDAVYKIIGDARTPNAGDLVLARVDALGHHKGLQLSNGRRKSLFRGDEIVVAYGNRYAPNQFEAVVPKTLGPCQLVAGGGVAGKAISWHSRISKGATQITPIGYLQDASGEPVNLRKYALPSRNLEGPCPTTIAVVGTAMDSGKTDTAAYLAKGLSLAGLRVGYVKVTGTGAGGDIWLLRDAGADPVLDFTDAGFVSTYLASNLEVEGILTTLMAHMGEAGVDAVVLEVADGILQPETAALLVSPVFRLIVGGILFAARDSMGAVAGEGWLRRRNLPILGLSGVMTSSPLQHQEATTATKLPVFNRAKLARPRTAMKILTWAAKQTAKRKNGVSDIGAKRKNGASDVGAKRKNGASDVDAKRS